jgi:hypothetical protein
MSAQESAPVNPFQSTAWQYHQAGWHPIPMPKGAKWPPPDGFTGHYDMAGPADIQDWIEGHEYRAGKSKIYPHNIALRLGPGEIGIDVDMYVKHGVRKLGRESLAELETEFGPLPRTLMTTARTDGSGIRLFRAPEGLAWPGAPKPGIEIIQMRHRYAMAPPSQNPEADNAPYMWLWSDLEPYEGIPNIGELAALSDAWIQGLTSGALATTIQREDLGRAHVVEWLTSHAADQPMCGYMTKVMRQHVDTVIAGAQGARHDAAVLATQAVCHLAAEGHTGVNAALSGLRTAFEYVTAGEDRPGEWDRMVLGAVQVAAGRHVRCLGDPCQDPYTGRDDNVHTRRSNSARGGQLARVHVLYPQQGIPEIQQPRYEAGIWDARPELKHIQELAKAQLASPFSVLGVVLARVVAAVPSFVLLPPVVGGYGSLNSFYAMVGKSGSGKGISERVASLGFDIAKPAQTFNAGSGEGLAHLYARRAKVKDENGKSVTVIERIRDSILLSIPEVDSLTALGGRSGSTLISQLRQAWSGEHLGFAYADPDKALPIDEHSYRLTLLVGVQPGRAGAILDDSDGGTPQRFIWLPTRLDADAPDDFMDPPLAWQWELPTPWKANSRGKVILGLPDAIRDFVRKENARLRKDPDSFELDEHFYYAQLKLSGAFALLARRQAINTEDWELAHELMKISLAERGYVMSVLANQAAEVAQKSGFAEGHKQLAVEKVVSDDGIKRASRWIVRKLSMSEWKDRQELYRPMASKDRPYFDEAIEILIQSGQIEQTEWFEKGRKHVGYKIVKGLR